MAAKAKKKSKKTKQASALRKFRPRIPRYFIESFNELKKVTWPSRKEAWILTFAVFVYSAIYLVYILAADDILKRIAERLFL